MRPKCKSITNVPSLWTNPKAVIKNAVKAERDVIDDPETTLLVVKRDLMTV